MPQRRFTILGMGHIPKIRTLSGTTCCITVHLIHNGEKMIEVFRKVARV